MDEVLKRESSRHRWVRDVITTTIERYRERIGLESVWTIQVVPCCPTELVEQEAIISWNAEAFYAQLRVRCTLKAPMLRWLALHELCELQMWRTGSMVSTLFQTWGEEKGSRLEKDALADIQRQWVHVRNQEIECRVFGLTGMRRPDHVRE